MNKLILLSAICFLIIGNSCGGAGVENADPSKNPVVTVRNKTLYQSDLSEFVLQGTSKEDSIATAETYIKMWIDDQLMYDKAKENLLNEKEIGELVENYRRSLIISSYQEQLLKQHFSKSISDDELRAYYDQHKDQLKLDESIIKGLFLKIPVNSPSLPIFQRWYKQTTDAAIENIEKNTLQSAVGYEYFYDRWVRLNDVMENIPYLVSDSEQFLKTNKNLEVRDSSFVYLLNIKEFELAGNTAPYDYIKARLNEVFIEQRKADYLKKVQQDLYDKALSGEEIKFYNK